MIVVLLGELPTGSCVALGTPKHLAASAAAADLDS
jgi:hypothetical protein